MPRVRKNSGFTLLEVLFSIAILATLALAFATMMRSSFEIKSRLANDGVVTHRIASALSVLANDLGHAYLIGEKDQVKNGKERKMKTVFKIDFGSVTDKVSLTSMSYKSVHANAPEGDAAYIVYEVRDSKEVPGRSDLYRGENPLFSDDFKDDPPMRVIAPNIRSIKVFAWNGEDWNKDRWDSSRSDWKDKLPHMVRIEVTGWPKDLMEGESDPTATAPDEESMVTLKTVVVIPNGFQYEEKKKLASIKWY